MSPNFIKNMFVFKKKNKGCTSPQADPNNWILVCLAKLDHFFPPGVHFYTELLCY